MEYQLSKVPPQSLEAEDAILSGCLRSKDIFEDVIDRIEVSDFYRSAHQKIFQSFLRLHEKGITIDLVSATNELRESNKLEEIGGATYLVKLFDEIPMTINAKHHCDLVRGKAILRRIIDRCTLSVQECFTGSLETSEIISSIQTDILNMKYDLHSDSFRTMKDIMPDTIERYEAMNERRSSSGIKTGFEEIDLCTGGFHRSKFIIIAARPRIGKTSLMMNMAVNMADAGTHVGILSIEMEESELTDKIIAMKTGINTMRLSVGTGPNGEDWVKIHRVGGDVQLLPITIDDTGGLTISEVRRKVKKMVKDGAKIVFIDQLSKIRGDRKKSKFEEVSAIVEDLATLKKELRIPIVLLAQINRGAVNREGNKPTLENLKNTGQIEEDADIIFLGHRPNVYDKNEDSSKAVWEIAKHRGGPEREIKMKWYGKITTFGDDPEGTK